MTCGLVSFKGGCIIQVKIAKKDKHGTATGCPWLLNRDWHIIQGTNTDSACMSEKSGL